MVSQFKSHGMGDCSSYPLCLRNLFPLFWPVKLVAISRGAIGWFVTVTIRRWWWPAYAPGLAKHKGLMHLLRCLVFVET